MESNSDGNLLKIGFAEGGGFGDALILANYAKEFAETLKGKASIDFFSKHPSFFQDYPYIQRSCSYSDRLLTDDYDLFIIGHRFLIIEKADIEKIASFSKLIANYCLDSRELFSITLAGDTDDNHFNQYALAHNKNRIEQGNVRGLLKIDRHTKLFTPIERSTLSILENLNLQPNTYLTIARGVDGFYGDTHPKLWPLERYEALIKELKQIHPDIPIVQLGASEEFGILAGADHRMVGRTSLAEAAVLLKYSMLHIDIEGGLVHLKNSVNGKSVVLFGPTSPDIYGYDNNVNIRTNECSVPCEWITTNWALHCIRNFAQPICMHSISVESVINAVVPEIERNLNSEYSYNATFVTPAELQSIDMGENTAVIGNPTIFSSFLKTKNISIFIFSLNEYSEIQKRIDTTFDSLDFELYFGSRLNLPIRDCFYSTVFLDGPIADEYCLFDIKEALRILSPNGNLVMRRCEKLTKILNSYSHHLNFNSEENSGEFIAITKYEIEGQL